MYWVFGSFTFIIALTMIARCIIISHYDAKDNDNMSVILLSFVSLIIYSFILLVILLTAVRVIKIKITGAHVLKLKKCQVTSIGLYVAFILLGKVLESVIFKKS